MRLWKSLRQVLHAFFEGFFELTCEGGSLVYGIVINCRTSDEIEVAVV